MENALKGKHYSRGMRLHKLTYKCLARRLLKSELIKPYLSNELKHPSENISKKEDVTNMHTMLINNIDFRNAVSSAFDQLQSSHSEHAKYWISYMVMVETLFLNYHALRSKQWNE